MSKAAQVNVDLTSKIAAGITIKVADNIATTVVDKDLYLNNLPEALTVDHVKALHEYNSEYFAASAKAFGEAALPVLKEHKKVDTITADFALAGKDNWAVGIELSHQYPNPKGGEPTTQFGAMSFKLETQAARGSRGMIKHVREEISTAALAMLGGK